MTIKINEEELIEIIGEEEYHNLVDIFAHRLAEHAKSNGDKFSAETGSVELKVNKFRHLIYQCSCEILPIGVDFGFTKMYLSTEVSP